MAKRLEKKISRDDEAGSATWSSGAF
jgi:hypothetical protein